MTELLKVFRKCALCHWRLHIERDSCKLALFAVILKMSQSCPPAGWWHGHVFDFPHPIENSQDEQFQDSKSLKSFHDYLPDCKCFEWAVLEYENQQVG